MSKNARLTLSRRQVIEIMSGAGHSNRYRYGDRRQPVERAAELRRLGGGTYRAHTHASSLAQVPTTVALLDRWAELTGHVAHYLKGKYSIAQALALTARKYPRLPTITAQAVYDWPELAHDSHFGKLMRV